MKKQLRKGILSLFFTGAALSSIAQSVTLTAPAGGETWNIGSYKEITWTSSGVNTVDILVSLNGGTSYFSIAEDVPAYRGSYVVNIGGTAGQQGIIKIKSSLSLNVNDSITTPVTLAAPATTPTVSASAFGSTYCTGKATSIGYTSSGSFTSTNTFMALLSDNTGSFNNNPRVLGKLIGNAASGTISLTIPNDVPPGSNYAIMVVADEDPAASTPQTFTISDLNAGFTPNASFYFTPATLAPVNVSCTGGNSAGSNIIWNFGDGSIVVGPSTSANHSYSQAGNYDVSMLVFDIPSGCSQLVRKPNLVNVDPVYPTIAATPATPLYDANDVSYWNKDTAIAVGKNGMTWMSIDGAKTWNAISTFTSTKDNNGVIMRNNYICIAGDSGTVTFSKNKGSTWQNSVQAQPLINYHDVAFADTTFGVAVGDNGDAVIYKWVGGLGWAHSPTATTQKLNAAATFKTSTSVFTTGDIIAVGDNGTMVTYTSGSWNTPQTIASSNLNGVYIFPDNVTVLAIGDNGLIMRSPDFGTTWNTLHSGTSEALHDLTEGVIPNQLLVVGDSGVIYESLDGGYIFTRYTVGFSNTNLRGASAKAPQGSFGGSGSTLRVFASDTVLVTGISDSTFCQGDNFKAYIQLGGLFGNANTVSLELSDASGSFASPVVIGTKLNPQLVDSITGTIPAGAASSSNYMVRISTSDPQISSMPFAANLVVNATPVSQTVQVNFTDVFVNSQAGCTYQWYFNGAPVNGATDTVLTTIGNGNYAVTITGSNGCAITTTAFNYTTTSIKTTTVASQIVISPNPASNMVSVRIPENLKDRSLRIYDALGRKVMTDTVKAGVNSFNISSLQEGVYFVAIDNYTSRLIIVK